MRPSVLEQRVNDLLRELNLLIYGADERELQNVLAALTAGGLALEPRSSLTEAESETARP